MTLKTACPKSGSAMLKSPEIVFVTASAATVPVESVSLITATLLVITFIVAV